MKPQPPQTDGFLTNGEPITGENVLERLRQLEAEWPAGTPWDDPKLNPNTRKNAVPSIESGKLMQNYRTNGTYGCGGYASMLSSLVFGDKTSPCHHLEVWTRYPESVPYTGNSVGAWPTGMTEEKTDT